MSRSITTKLRRACRTLSPSNKSPSGRPIVTQWPSIASSMHNAVVPSHRPSKMLRKGARSSSSATRRRRTRRRHPRPAERGAGVGWVGGGCGATASWTCTQGIAAPVAPTSDAKGAVDIIGSTTAGPSGVSGAVACATEAGQSCIGRMGPAPSAPQGRPVTVGGRGVGPPASDSAVCRGSDIGGASRPTGSYNRYLL
jgi:hypothetical protein